MIRKEYIKASLGQISSLKFWEQIGFWGQYPKIEQEYLDKCFSLDLFFKPIAMELKNDFKLALLSNDLAEWSAYLRKKFLLNVFFDAIIIIGEVKYRKLDKKIYQILLEKIEI